MVAGRVIFSAIREVISRQLLAEHFLMSIASIGAIYLGEYTEAIAVIALYELGQYLEAKAVSRSRGAISSIVSLKPELAHLKTNDGIQDVKLGAVKQGDLLLVYPGERIPLDGRIMKGESSLDTSGISGESAPMAVQAGDEVYAGCLNQSGLLELQVSHIESESMVARILSLIDNAASRKSRQERFITRFARIYTPI
ncbi:MAG TPA: heavy metal translocating P-type ATPase, partial [Candidatus Cloacimonas sp.]|nr:heavy metal translocating P-type ATPase [Candidatus Cloacimonas sp.]